MLVNSGLKKIKKYQVISFTFGFLVCYHFTRILIAYFSDRSIFVEIFDFNIWFWLIGIPAFYYLQWLLVVWIASKFTKEKLKQKFLRHPIVTISLFILYVIDLPYRLVGYGRGGIVIIFETIVYYAFISFLWWLLVCWISSKIFKKQRFQWSWYQNVIEKLTVLTPIAYKIILGLIVSFILFYILFVTISVIFKYSGQDLKLLFS